MKKKTYPQIDLSCVFQQVNNIVNGQCLNGIISREDDNTFRFEETIRKGRGPRNPKLFEGKHISMVRTKNGKIQFYMKSLTRGFNQQSLPLDVYIEIKSALKILD